MKADTIEALSLGCLGFGTFSLLIASEVFGLPGWGPLQLLIGVPTIAGWLVLKRAARRKRTADASAHSKGEPTPNHD